MPRIVGIVQRTTPPVNQRILVMCQGEQTRLAQLGYPKQLIPIAGEPMLARTMRLIRERRQSGTEICVIGRCSGPLGGPLFDVAMDYHASVTELASPGLCVVDGILAALGWMERGTQLLRHSARTVVLLGDVCWSEAALHALLDDPRDLVFAGTPDVTASTGEVFGCVFDNVDELSRLANTCPCRVRPSGEKLSLGDKQRGGHLRRLLWWAMEARRVRSDMPSRTWAPALYLPITDYTDDIDTPEDLKNVPRLEIAVRAELAAKRAAAEAANPPPAI